MKREKAARADGPIRTQFHQPIQIAATVKGMLLYLRYLKEVELLGYGEAKRVSTGVAVL